MPINTKQFIADALYELMKQKSLDKITVKDLVSYCNISRTTFYYYYKDIIDVIEYRISKKLDSITELALQQDTAIKAIEIYVSTTNELHDMMHMIFASNRQNEFEEIVINSIKAYIKELFPDKFSDATNGFESESALHFYACGFSGLLLKYLGNCDIKKLSQQIYRFLNSYQAQ